MHEDANDPESLCGVSICIDMFMWVGPNLGVLNCWWGCICICWCWGMARRLGCGVTEHTFVSVDVGVSFHWGDDYWDIATNTTSHWDDIAQSWHPTERTFQSDNIPLRQMGLLYSGSEEVIQGLQLFEFWYPCVWDMMHVTLQVQQNTVSRCHPVQAVNTVSRCHPVGTEKRW